MATTWYAQSSSANVDSVNMWNDVANGSGNFLTWPPASDDILVANAKTSINLNVDFTCATVSNKPYAGTANGSYTITTSRTFNFSIETNAVTCVSVGATSLSIIINGNVSGGTGTTIVGISVAGPNGVGTNLTVNGDLFTFATGANAIAISSTNTILTYTGTINSVSGHSSLSVTGADPIITINSNITNLSTTSSTAVVTASGARAILTVNGDIRGSSNATLATYALLLGVSGVATINGNVYAGNTSGVGVGYGIRNLSNIKCVINGALINYQGARGSAIIGSFVFGPIVENYMEIENEKEEMFRLVPATNKSKNIITGGRI
jgi:hypothetical protein